MSDKLLVGGVITGLLFTGGAVAASRWISQSEREFHAHAIPATGTLVDRIFREERNRRDEMETIVIDVYTFTPPGSGPVRVTAFGKQHGPQLPFGTQAPVLYRPDDPSDSRLAFESKERSARWMLWASPAGLLYSALHWFMLRRRDPPEASS